MMLKLLLWEVAIMAKCPNCEHVYGVFGANRTAWFQSCPNCGWSPVTGSDDGHAEALREKEQIRELEKDGYCPICKTFRDCRHKRGY